MRRSVRWAAGLWAALAAAVFMVTFDWETRAAGHRFARSQVTRQAQGLPVATINDGFRPMVRSAARQSTVWLVLILGTGGVATVAAARASR